jgi:hypothetical protein
MIGLVYGFVMIESPEKVFGTEHAVEEVVNEEVIAEEEVAPSEEVAESIRNGTLSPHERHFYDASLVRIQKQGVKSKLFNDLAVSSKMLKLMMTKKPVFFSCCDMFSHLDLVHNAGDGSKTGTNYTIIVHF